MAARTEIQAGLSADRILIDVTRLIWRAWRGRRPTGIDRVCLAYVDHFRDRALAVVQRKGLVTIFSKAQSRKIFDLLLRSRRPSKTKVIITLARAGLTSRHSPPWEGMFYLNVGHTGLNDKALPKWIDRFGVKAIYLVHDLIPITHPELCRPGEANRHSERIANALESGTGIIGNSKVTLDELAKFAKDKSLRMPTSIVAWIAGLDRLARVNLRGIEKPYFLTVGTIEARKNHLLLLIIWRRLHQTLGEDAPRLVIVGQPGWEAEEALQILGDLGELRGTVQRIDDCTDEALSTWIAGARALLMPSLAEGFGLPVVEALGMGTPVIASDLAVFREIAGEIPTYLPPSDEFAWEKQVLAFVGDGPERTRQAKALDDYRPASWPEHFEVVEDWLATL